MTNDAGKPGDVMTVPGKGGEIRGRRTRWMVRLAAAAALALGVVGVSAALSGQGPAVSNNGGTTGQIVVVYPGNPGGTPPSWSHAPNSVYWSGGTLSTSGVTSQALAN